MKYTYEVWAVGFDKDYLVTDFEQLLGEFNTKKEAEKFFDEFNPNGKVETEYLNEGDIIHIQIEKVIHYDFSSENLEIGKEKAYTYSNGTFS